jgi:hypothetical protein
VFEAFSLVRYPSISLYFRSASQCTCETRRFDRLTPDSAVVFILRHRTEADTRHDFHLPRSLTCLSRWQEYVQKNGLIDSGSQNVDIIMPASSLCSGPLARSMEVGQISARMSMYHFNNILSTWHRKAFRRPYLQQQIHSIQGQRELPSSLSWYHSRNAHYTQISFINYSK